MRLGRFLRRRWPLVLVVILLLGWYPAFHYLTEFRAPDVPYVTTPPDVVAAMLDLAEVKPGDVVYDLGSGDGRIPIAAARDRGARAVGIEIDPELAEQSREAIRAEGLSDRVRIIRGDIFRQDLTPATVVTMYLKPLVNADLRPQFDRLPPGVRIVSHMFSMPGANPRKKIEVQSTETGRAHLLYLWVTPIEWTSSDSRP